MPESSEFFKCTFGAGFICVSGYRYRPLADDGVRAAPENPIHKDLPGMLYVGKCDCCTKVTGGVK